MNSTFTFIIITNTPSRQDMLPRLTGEDYEDDGVCFSLAKKIRTAAKVFLRVLLRSTVSHVGLAL